MSHSQASVGTSTQESVTDYAPSPLSSTSRFPVLRYIEECGLPLVHVGGKESIIMYNVDWPTYRDLKRSLDVRLLRRVVSVGPTNVLAEHAKSCQSSIYIFLHPSSHRSLFIKFFKPDLKQFTPDKLEQQSPTEGEANPFLFLPCPVPCPTLKQYYNDIPCLSNIQNGEKSIVLMQKFVLGTISELIRVMERLPIESPLAQNLKFKVSNNLHPVTHARWDLFTLVSGIMLMRHVWMVKLIVVLAAGHF